jgi:hypothetical protein
VTWHSYSINTSRSAKSGLPNRANFHRITDSNPSVHPSIHPTPHHAHLCPIKYLERKRGKGGAGLAAVFFMLSGDYTPWRGYISLHLLMLRFQPFISSQCRLICLLFYFFPPFFGLLKPNVNIDWPHTLPIHWLSLLFSDLYALRSLLHAYHSLLVWPLYQQREHSHLPTSRASYGK